MVSSITPPEGLQIIQYLALLILNVLADPVNIQSKNSVAEDPDMYILPIWETSNNPTFVRTDSTSEMIPEYCTGISQPPNGTIRAPAAR